VERFERAIESRHEMERAIGYAMWAVDVASTGSFIREGALRDSLSGHS
jgi:hypothetical protein